MHIFLLHIPIVPLYSEEFLHLYHVPRLPVPRSEVYYLPVLRRFNIWHVYFQQRTTNACSVVHCRCLVSANQQCCAHETLWQRHEHEQVTVTVTKALATATATIVVTAFESIFIHNSITILLFSRGCCCCYCSLDCYRWRRCAGFTIIFIFASFSYFHFFAVRIFAWCAQNNGAAQVKAIQTMLI